MNRLFWTTAAIAVGLSGCDAPETANEIDNGTVTAVDNQMVSQPAADRASPMRAVATLQTAEGATAGTATATAGDNGIEISIKAERLPAGQHGAHVHMVGQCDAPGFESAGDHWNPANTEHGLENPRGPHAGDMPNLRVNEDGSGTLEYTLQGGSLDGLLDADGSALVIHASPDDQTSNPSGNSGARIACGVFESGRV